MSCNVNTATAAREAAKISGAPDAKTASKEGDKGPGLRLHSGRPDYEKYRYGYPLTPGRMFGSGELMDAPSQLPPGSPAPPCAASDGAPPVRRTANPTSEEMREYHEQRRYMLVRVGSTWMFGSGN